MLTAYATLSDVVVTVVHAVGGERCGKVGGHVT